VLLRLPRPGASRRIERLKDEEMTEGIVPIASPRSPDGRSLRMGAQQDQRLIP
jgi:hypothetical protein